MSAALLTTEAVKTGESTDMALLVLKLVACLLRPGCGYGPEEDEALLEEVMVEPEEGGRG